MRLGRGFWVGLLLGALVVTARAELVVARESLWQFRKGTNEVSSPLEAWRGSGYSTAGWPAGRAPFHYGEAGITVGTRLGDMRNAYSCVFLRRSFDLPVGDRLGSVTLTAWCDDGFVAWINGVEVARYRVNAGPVTFSSVANSSAPEPVAPVSYTFTNLALFKPAGNILAVQAFNRARDNGDFQFDAQLEAAPRDDTPPRMVAVDPPPGRVGALDQIQVTFSEAVQGLDEEDLTVNGVPCQRISGGGSVFTFHFPQPAYGAVAVAWAAAPGVSDLASPPNLLDLAAGFASWQYDLADGVRPALTGQHPAPGSGVRVLAAVEVEFSEAVTGLEAGDLLVNGQPARDVRGFGHGRYVFTFPPVPDGPATLAWAVAHGITDLADPPNSFAGEAWTVRVDSQAAMPPIAIVEFCASNVSGLRDEDGDAEDWIELVNAGDAPVDLAGWSLTDDPGEPGKWGLPSGILPAGERLVVFASGKDRREAMPGARWHTNFKLAGDGEYLALFNSDSPRSPVTEFKPRYPDQRNDHSYGLTSGGWRYFATPTPGAPNDASTLSGVVEPVAFSVARGFFSQPFSLTLSSSTPGAEIWYTTDGSVPGPTNGRLYAGPVAIETTTVLRAAAFGTDALPSRVTTHTYLFPAAVWRQPAQPPGFPATWGASKVTPGDYAMDPRVVDDPAHADLLGPGLTNLPALCLTLPVEDWFSPARGIYSNGEREGIAWERAGSLEFFAPDGDSFQENCGLRIQGGSSTQPWKSYKLSLRATFRNDYGPARLEHALFPGSPVQRFNTFILDAGLNYFWSYGGGVSPEEQRRRAKYVADQFASDLQTALGTPAPRGRFVHLFLNGLYWGLHNLHEEPEAAFAAEWFGGAPEEYDVIKHTGDNVLDGDPRAWNAMLRLARSVPADPAAYGALSEQLDLPSLADYLIVHFYLGNTDWPQHNWYAVRRRVPGGLWRFISWDSEHVLKSPTEDRTGVNHPNSPAELYALLRGHPEFRLLFADRAHRAFFNGGPLQVNPARPAWNPASPQDNQPAASYQRRVAEIDLALIAESARWGDNQRPAQPYTRHVEYRAELNWLHTQYFPVRSANVLQQLRAAGLYPGVAAPAFNQHGGWVPRGFALTLTAPAGVIYYTLDGSDPRVPGAGTPHPRAQVWRTGQSLALTAPVWVKARALANGVWSALTEARFAVGEADTPLRLTELMYDSGSGSALDFLELMNTSPADLDVSGWSLDGVRFVFPPGTVLPAGTIIVLTADTDPAAFARAHPGLAPYGAFGGGLANDGETLALREASGRSLWKLRYDPQPPWPAANGTGRSLEIVDPAGDPNDPANWRASDAPGGTPGRRVRPPAAIVRLNELLAAPSPRPLVLPPEPDWIELLNTANVPISLARWSLSDGRDPRRFVFPPDAILAANGFLTLIATDAAGWSGLATGFGLAREGQTVTLYDDATNVVDSVTYGPALVGASLGRGEAGEWTLNRPTPGATNAPLPVVAADFLAINEWVANPLPGEDDWLELHNRHPTGAVNVLGCEVATATARARLGYPAFVAPGGFLRLWATGRSGPDSAGLKLPAAGGFIELRNPSGALVDRVAYPAQSEGPSSGRLPDGTGLPKVLSALTPGGPNSDSPADSDWDGDGLPDTWETAHGLDARRAGGTDGRWGDADGDLASNAEELAAGTHPLSALSRLALRLVQAPDGRAWLRLPAVAGRAYVIEVAASFRPDGWEVLQELGPLEVSGDLEVPLTAGVDVTRFFRVRLK
jgi:hypothetical protein